MKKLKNDELNRLDIKDFKDSRKSNFVLVLDDIRSLNNVGSAFRTGDAFRCQKIYLCGITGKPPHRDIQKTALGATESVTWEYQEDILSLVGKLKAENYQIIAIEQADESLSLENFNPQKEEKYAFVFGNEVFGVKDEIVENADFCIEIPQYGTKHSLNISVSLGIVAWDYFSKVQAFMEI